MPDASELRSRRDSWPPTQVHLHSTSKEDVPRSLLDDLDDDPLTYFLTPAPDTDDFEADFDAGIQSPDGSVDVVRSVSPSSLDGLRRSPSPDQDSDATSDDEEYIRFSSDRPTSRHSWLSRDLAVESLRYRPRTPTFGRSANALLLPSPSSHLALPSRGRSAAKAPRRGALVRTMSAKARPRQLWREPSPDVWSIEEETEEEMLSEGESRREGIQGGLREGSAARPKKKVRFMLPPEELTA